MLRTADALKLELSLAILGKGLRIPGSSMYSDVYLPIVLAFLRRPLEVVLRPRPAFRHRQHEGQIAHRRQRGRMVLA